MKRKEISLWSVCEKSSGKFLGSYYAYNEQAAINRLISDDANTASTFRSQPSSIKAENCKATKIDA